MHAACCLCIYVNWWNKPFEIEEPLVFNTSDRLQQVCARLMLEGDPSHSYPCRNNGSREWQLSYVGNPHSPEYAASVDRESRQESFYPFQARRVDGNLEQLQHQLGQSKNYKKLKLFGDQVCYGLAPRPISTCSYYDDCVRTEYKPKDAWLELKSHGIFRLKLAHCLKANDPVWTFSYDRAPMFVN